MTDNKVIDSMIEMFSEDAKWNLAIAGSGAALKRHPCLEEELKSKIKMCLSGDDLTPYDMRQIRRHFELEDVLRDETVSHLHAAIYLRNLFVYYGIDRYEDSPTRFTKAPEKWLEALGYLADLINLDSHKDNLDMEDDLHALGCLIKGLRSDGYAIPHERCRFWPNDKDRERFAQTMKGYFKVMGRKAVSLILKDIAPLHMPIVDRYGFRAEPKTIQTPEFQVPWGYLLNVAFDYLNEAPTAKSLIELQKAYEQAKVLSKRFIAILELQTLNKFAAMYRPPEECIDELVENICYEQQYAMEQLPCEDMRDILKGLIANTSQNRKADVYLAILNWVCEKKVGLKPVRFDFQEIMTALKQQFNRTEVEIALRDLSTDVEKLNKGYITPMEVTKRNYFLRPFVKSTEGYVMWSTHFFSKGFYMVWFKNCCKEPDKVGFVFEDVFRDMLVAKGIDFIHSGKYDVTHEEQLDLKSERESGECDFVIEGCKSLFYIELKKKEITGKAMAGSDIDAMKDMSASVLHGCTQALIHEYCMRRRGALDLTLENGDVETVKSTDRLVEKIHVSPFDHYGLHDNVFLEHYLSSVVRYGFSSKKPEELEKFSQIQEEFRNALVTATIRNAYTRGALRSFHSYSLPQLMVVLRNSNSTEDFCRELSATFRITFSTGDWYREYGTLKSMGLH